MMLSSRSAAGRLLLGMVLGMVLLAAVLSGCKNVQTGQDKPALVKPAQDKPAPLILRTAWVQPSDTLPAQPAAQTTATPIALGPLFPPETDLMTGPVEVPIELRIPALDVKAPVVGVGLTAQHVMDTPKGPIGDPIWDTAYWYRGSGIPGESGTATFAGHVNEPLGRPEIFANLEDLDPGDEIIVHYSALAIDIVFIVDQVKVYSLQESSDPAVLARIFGSGPVSGKAPQPAPDGQSHLSLITCAGNIVNGQFDHHTVVYATRR